MPRKSEARAEPEKKRRRGRPPTRDTGAYKEEWGDARVIKKYGNRRLYDGSRSQAVTLPDIAEMVRRKENVRVVDGETGADITRRVLTQVILEEQNAQILDVLPLEFLRALISMHDPTLHGWINQYLAAGADWLENNARIHSPRALQDQIAKFFPWLQSLRPTDGKKAAPAADEQPPATAARPAEPADEEDVREEIDALQRRLAHLASKVKRR